MQTPGTYHASLDRNPTRGDQIDAAAPAPTPAVVVAGSRITREFVRLLVAGAFCIAEAVFRLDESRIIKVFHRKRRV